MCCFCDIRGPLRSGPPNLHEHVAQHAGAALHVFLEVPVEELKDQVELALALDAVLQLNDVVVTELTEEGDLAEGGGGDTLVLHLETDAL